jgi:hypothetical protein
MENQFELSINTAVKAISKLPELVIPREVVFETPEEQKIINNSKSFYRAKGEWLKHLVLHQALAPEAIFTTWKHFQGHAILDSSLLTLITGLHSRLPILQESCPRIDAPVVIWFQAMIINCRTTFIQEGLLGKSNIIGKVKWYQNELALLEVFNEHIIRIQPPKENPNAVPNGEIDFRERPETYLKTLASELASQDEDFDKDYWQPYSKTRKRWIRKIRDNKHLQMGCLLPSGELYITGGNKKIPSSVRHSS